ncbi:hypothetical protein GCM10020367_72350 [Streptomyces sannanensis]|uniref:Aminoglycoside phosphotransferase domain-containing protein n=1 Tax=Streptomyces sannanensis TaxID=285536 RepID=A0ABP6SNM6_9ACTN
MYNTTYRITVDSLREPVILRIAPAGRQQINCERELMRDEYATVPYLSPIAGIVPRVLFADWSQEITGRDWIVQSHLTGVPAPERLHAYPRDQWPGFFAQLGEITARVHAVHSPHFGPVAGPGHRTWSAAVIASLNAIAGNLEHLGLDAADVRKVADLATEHHHVLDEITEPRLLTGDLWTVNTMLDSEAPEPVITGVLDLDRTLFGDPAADWTIRMACAKPGGAGQHPTGDTVDRRGETSLALRTLRPVHTAGPRRRPFPWRRPDSLSSAGSWRTPRWRPAGRRPGRLSRRRVGRPASSAALPNRARTRSRPRTEAPVGSRGHLLDHDPPRTPAGRGRGQAAPSA